MVYSTLPVSANAGARTPLRLVGVMPASRLPNFSVQPVEATANWPGVVMVKFFSSYTPSLTLVILWASSRLMLSSSRPGTNHSISPPPAPTTLQVFVLRSRVTMGFSTLETPFKGIFPEELASLRAYSSPRVSGVLPPRLRVIPFHCLLLQVPSLNLKPVPSSVPVQV